MKAPRLPYADVQSFGSAKGRGIFVLAASSTDERAKEGNRGYSVFTRHIVEGIRRGARATEDKVSFDSLYEYVDHVVVSEVNQRPMRIVMANGDLTVAFRRSERPLRAPTPVINAAESQPKTLIVCCDQISNHDPAATNVQKLYAALSSQDTLGRRQFAFYDTADVTPILSKSLGPFYNFLAEYYIPGDSIHIFGAGKAAIAARELTSISSHYGIYEVQLPVGSAIRQR